MDKVTGYVTGVNGNLVSASFSGSVRKNEVGYVLVGDDRLKGEVIRVNGDTASMQIYEMTNGIQVGDKVELSGELTLLGITRPETFQVTVTPEGPAFRLVAEGEIRRSDFGMTGDLPLVSDAVTITVSTIAVAG